MIRFTNNMKLPKTFNLKVVIFSLIALGFIALTFTVNPYFVIGAVIFMLLNQRELKRKKAN
jgi:hypothetical protein